MYLTLEDIKNLSEARNTETIVGILNSIEYAAIPKCYINDIQHFCMAIPVLKKIRNSVFEKETVKEYTIKQLRNYFQRSNIHQLLAREEFVRLIVNKRAYKNICYRMTEDDLFRLFCAIKRRYVDYDTPETRDMWEKFKKEKGEINEIKHT